MKGHHLVVLLVLLVGISLGTALHAATFAAVHKAAGVECSSCHGKDKKDIITRASCLSCHNSDEEIGALTSDMHLNPHLSPHFLELECTSCHTGHKELNNFCQQCHGPIKRH